MVQKISQSPLVWKLTITVIVILTASYALLLYLSHNFTYKYPVSQADNVSIRSTPIDDQDFLYAIKYGSAKNVNTMLAEGANPNAVDPNGRSALEIGRAHV